MGNRCSSTFLIPSAAQKYVQWCARTFTANQLSNLDPGMRGENTEVLTYRGPDLAERDRARQAAGCVDGYCRDLIARKLVPSSFDSCDEVSAIFNLVGNTYTGFSTPPRAVWKAVTLVQNYSVPIAYRVDRTVARERNWGACNQN